MQYYPLSTWPIYPDRCVEVLDLLESSLCKAMLGFTGCQQSSCSKSVTATTGQGDKCLSGPIRPQPHNPEWRFNQTKYADSKKCNNPPRVTLTHDSFLLSVSLSSADGVGLCQHRHGCALPVWPTAVWDSVLQAALFSVRYHFHLPAAQSLNSLAFYIRMSHFCMLCDLVFTE